MISVLTTLVLSSARHAQPHNSVVSHRPRVQQDSRWQYDPTSISQHSTLQLSLKTIPSCHRHHFHNMCLSVGKSARWCSPQFWESRPDVTSWDLGSNWPTSQVARWTVHGSMCTAISIWAACSLTNNQLNHSNTVFLLVATEIYQRYDPTGM